jgi:hypothetical protein
VASNHKLTAVLQGRRVMLVDRVAAAAVLHFDDGSTMTVQVGAGGLPAVPPLGCVRGVRQKGTTLDLDYDGGVTLELTTAEATSSVLLRAVNGTLEYAD